MNPPARKCTRTIDTNLPKKGASGLPGRLLRVRLPEDHWVWQIEDPEQRSAEVRAALDVYRRFGREIEKLNRTVEEIKDMLQRGYASVSSLVSSSKGEETEDPRFAALDKFLEF